MDAFFQHYFERVYGYVVRLVRNPSLAEDISQDAFLRLSRSLESLDPRRDPSGWVFTVVTNVVRDYWRSRHAKAAGRRVDADRLWETAEDPADSPQQQLERRERHEAIQQALARLAPADREVLLLRTYEEIETAQVGKILGLRPDAVRQRHSRAVRRLGELYRDAMGEESGR